MDKLQPRKQNRPIQEGRHNIVIGQNVSSDKVQQAKELRRRMTEEEKILWQYLRANRLNGWHFRRQHIIDGFITDFYCHAAGLVVEVDGKIHEKQVEYDVERDQIITSRHLRLLRIKNEEIRQNLEQVIMRIAAACQEKT
ncbi:MAG: endonuclease domain-containing protein [Chroococcales cyanobacterium]